VVIFVKPIYNINRFELQECGDYTWRLSDCEELVRWIISKKGCVI